MTTHDEIIDIIKDNMTLEFEMGVEGIPNEYSYETALINILIPEYMYLRTSRILRPPWVRTRVPRCCSFRVKDVIFVRLGFYLEFGIGPKYSPSLGNRWQPTILFSFSNTQEEAVTEEDAIVWLKFLPPVGNVEHYIAPETVVYPPEKFNSSMLFDRVPKKEDSFYYCSKLFREL
jgi:hypothetical protein